MSIVDSIIMKAAIRGEHSLFRWFLQYYFMVTQALQETCVPLEKWRPQQKRDPENNFSLSLNRMYNYDSETPGMIRAYERINAVKVRSYLLLKTNSKPEHLDFAKAYPDQVPINIKDWWRTQSATVYSRHLLPLLRCLCYLEDYNKWGHRVILKNNTCKFGLIA